MNIYSTEIKSESGSDCEIKVFPLTEMEAGDKPSGISVQNNEGAGVGGRQGGKNEKRKKEKKKNNEDSYMSNS